MRFSRLFLPGLLSAITLLAGCDSTRSGPVRVEGPVQVEGPVAVSGSVEVQNPVRVEGPVAVTGTLEGIQGAIRIQGPVETTGRLQGIDSSVSVQGTVGLSGPVEVRPGAEPLRVVTADTDPSRLVSRFFNGGWGSSYRAIEHGPLVLTSAALTAYSDLSSEISTTASTRLFYVAGNLALNAECTAALPDRTQVLFLQANVLPAVIGTRIFIPAGHTLCVSGAYAVLISGFRPY